MTWSTNLFLVDSPHNVDGGMEYLSLPPADCKDAVDDCIHADFIAHELTLPDHVVVELNGTVTAIVSL